MIAAVVAAWLGIALVLTVVMTRRGHDAFQWALLGAVLGPLAVPLAIAHREKVVMPRTGAPTAGGEPGRVLVGVQPGATLEEIAPALRRLTALAGPVPVTLATVLDAEACERPTGATLVAEAEAFLDRVATALVEAAVTAHPVERQVLFGDPASALAAHAEQCASALIAVGAGEPLTRRAVHGSTRSRLLRHATVPVLCVPSHAVAYRGKKIAAAARRS